MRKLFLILCAALLLYLGKNASSADFQRGLDAYYKKDYETALREWEPLVEAGIAKAQYYLGIIYEHGQGVPKDLERAVQLYRFAAEQGDVGAQYGLAMAYTQGSGDGKGVDYVTAHMWANVAASNGSKGGAKLRDWVLNRMSLRDIQEAKSLLRMCVLSKYKNCFREK